jgi:hypothetical protein
VHILILVFLIEIGGEGDFATGSIFRAAPRAPRQARETPPYPMARVRGT